MKIRDKPPMTKFDTNPKANSIGEVKRIVPPQKVPSQLKTLMADGTAMTMVVIMNAVPSSGFMPLTNI